MNKCEKCGFLHYRTDPCRGPKNTNGDKAEPSADAKPNLKRQLAPVKSAGPVRSKSTAARKDVRQVVGSDGFRKASDPSNAAGEKAFIAGTLALPVDTTPESSKWPRTPSQGYGGSSPHSGAKFDRKAWMREYQRNYMRNVYRPKLKTSKSNPNTPERNDE